MNRFIRHRDGGFCIFHLLNRARLDLADVRIRELIDSD
jgi:hypothetical protein